jgi:hypothetical protein
VIDEEVFGHVVAPLLAPLIRPVIVKYSQVLPPKMARIMLFSAP